MDRQISRGSNGLGISLPSLNNGNAEGTARKAVDAIGEKSEQLVSSLGAATVTVALLIILRVFSLAQWNWEVARDIMTTVDVGDIPSIILGTIYSMPTVSALIIAVVGPLIIVHAVRGYRRTRKIDPVLAVLVSLFVAATVSLLVSYGSWWILPLLGCVAVALAATLNSRAPSKIRKFANTLVSHAVIACVVLELLIAAFSNTPWMEHERIELTSGKVVDGYVLKIYSGFIKLLDDDRQVIYLQSGDIDSMSIQ